MPRVTKKQLQKHSELITEASELAAKARTLKKEADRIADAAAADLKASKRETITRGGFRIWWDEKKASISWKNELVDAKGVEFVTAIEENAEVVKKVAIEPPKN